MLNVCIAFAFNGLLAFAAFTKKSLTLDGAVTATFLGSTIWLLGGFQAFLLMGIFFVSSSLLSKFKKAKRASLHLEKLHDKSDRRDYTQVLANGLGPLLFLVVAYLTNHAIWYIGFVGAFCTANADTWASEIGVLSPKAPKFLIKRTTVKPGLSGGVTSLGLLASFMGSALIACSFFALSLFSTFVSLPIAEYLRNPLTINLVQLIAVSILLVGCGFLGSLIDSFLGEVIQAKYQSKNPLVGLTERVYDDTAMNHEANLKVSGVSWVNNNTVNLISVISAPLFIMWICSFWV